jgi:hypothetical protein
VVRGELRALDDLQYRLLADRAEGRALRTSPHWSRLCRKRAEIRAWMARAGQLAGKAGRACSEAEAWQVAHQAIQESRARGLSLRRARFVLWLHGLTPGRGVDAPGACG